MAGPRTCRNAGGAPINDRNISVSKPAVSCTPTPALAQTLALAQAPAPVSASAPSSPGRYTDKDLQKATKLALELFVKGQEYGQLQRNFAPCKQSLKTWVFRPVLLKLTSRLLLFLPTI